MMEFFEDVDLYQRIAFLATIAHLARVDGDFDGNEKQFFVDLAKLYNHYFHILIQLNNYTHQI